MPSLRTYIVEDSQIIRASLVATPEMRRECRMLGADRVSDKSNEIDALIQFCGQLAAGATAHGTPA